MLLSLPRELRDMIIEYVLLTPLPHPHPDPFDIRTFRHLDPPPNAVSWRRPAVPLPQLCSFLHETNQQLRAETLERAAKLNVAPVLDLLAQPDGTPVYTWLNRPLAHPSRWGRIPVMDVRLRVQPVSFRLWWDMDEDERILEDGEGGAGPQLRWLERRSRESCAEIVMETIREALLRVLHSGEPTPNTLDWQPAKNADETITGACCNSIATLSVEVTAAVDDTGKDIQIPQDANSREWYIDEPDMAERISFLVGLSEEPMLERAHSDFDLMLILTHVGSIEFCSGKGKGTGCTESNTETHKLGGAALDELDTARRYLSPEMRLAIKKTRLELGWNDAEDGAKKMRG